MHFDVHAVRTRAERELARAEADLVDLEVFTDWTRERGLGPDNRERGAFAKLPAKVVFARSSPSGKSEMLRRAVACGGWPGNLAREYARLGLGRADIVTAPARARVARRVLEALAGQPSECTWCGGVGEKVVDLDNRDDLVDEMNRLSATGWQTSDDGGHVGAARCPTCRGTGHNLRGTLPPLVAPPAVRRRRADQGVDEDGVPTEVDWFDNADIVGHMAPGWAVFLRDREDPASGSRLCADTRVVERGRHRGDHERWSECERSGCDLDTRINGRGWCPRFVGAHRDRIDEMRPRWRRGELRHERRRRERGAWVRRDLWSIEVGPSPSDR